MVNDDSARGVCLLEAAEERWVRGCRQAAHPAFIMATERLPRANSPLETKAVDQLTLCPFTDRRDSYSKDKLARLWGAQGVSWHP